MNIAAFNRKLLLLSVVLMLSFNASLAEVIEPDSYDTLSLCQSELPSMYDAFEITGAGDFQVTLSSSLCTDSIVQLHVIVHPNPVPVIDGDMGHCVNSNATVWVGEEYSSYLWSNGSEFYYNFTSDSSCSVEVSNEWGCKGTASLDFEVYQIPEITISGNRILCYMDSMVLKEVSGLKTCYWFDRHNVRLSNTDSLVYWANEGYGFTDTVMVRGYSMYGCVSPTTIIEIEVAPQYEIMDTVRICRSELPYQYAGQEFSQSGMYDVYLTSAQGCDSVVHLNLTVLENPYAHIDGVLEMCQGESTLLHANGVGSYVWSTGDTHSPITVDTPGSYKLTVLAPNGCQTVDSVEVSYLPLPEISISGLSGICAGTSVTLTASGASSYIWNSTVMGSSLTVTPTESTMYTVVGTSNRGCTATASHFLNVNALPTASINGESTICQGDTAVFTATGGLDYLWSTAETTASVKLTSAGSYSVIVTDANACSITVEKTLTVNNKPDVSIIGPDYLCANGTINITAKGSGVVSCVWNNAYVGQTYTVTSPGTYVVEVTSYNGCTATASTSIVEMANPQISISGNLSFCDGQYTLLTASGGSSCRWINAYGTQISNSTEVLVSDGGVYSVTVTDANACSSSQQVTVSKKSLPNVSIFASRTEFCYGEQETLTALSSPGSSYQWSTGSTNGQITVNTGGVYVLQATTNGCVAQDSVTITVHSLPDVSIEGPSSVCLGDTAIFSAVSTAAVSYRWSTTSTGNEIRVNEPGTYSLEVTSIHACKNSCSKQLAVNEKPSVSINAPSAVCYDSQAVLTAYGTGTSYQWLSGETGTTLLIQPTEAGNYQVTAFNDYACSATASAFVGIYEMYDTTVNVSCCRNDLPYMYNGHALSQAGSYDIHLTSVHGCDSLVHLYLTVLENPFAFISGNTAVCPGRSTQLYANGSGSFVWQDGSTYSPITVNTPEWYVLTVTATNGCQAYDSVQVTLLPLPEVAISGNNQVCRGSEVNLTASGASSYVWNTGMMGAVLTVSPTQTFTYVVTGTSAEGCTSTASHTVTVNGLPTANISGIDAVCQGDTAVFTASGGMVYHWSTGAMTASIRVSNAQTYTVTVVDANACTASASKSLTVYNNPSVSVVGSTSFCENGSTVLTATGIGVSSYVWDNLYLNQSITVTQAGTHTVVATSPNGCTSTISVSVTQLPNPSISVSGELSFCDGQSTQLTAAGAQTYSWRNAFGIQIATGTEVSLNEAGGYFVIATDSNGCSASQQFMLTKKSLPNVTIIASDNEVCEGTNVNLSAGFVSGYTYLWSTGSTDRQITVNTPGTYVLQVAYNGCTAMDSAEIIMFPIPQIRFIGETVICEGDSTIIYASAPGITSYLWNNGSHDNYLIAAPTVSTDYWVRVGNIHGCFNQDTVRVVVEELPQVNITGPDSICKGDTARLMVSGGVTYLWDDGSTDSLRSVFEPGIYTVTAYTTAGCTAIAQKTIHYYDETVVRIEGDSTMCQGDSVLLTAHGAVSYLWSDGSTDTCLTVLSTGTYDVQGWDAHGCSARDTFEVRTWALPTVQVVGNSSGCSGDVNTITAQSPTAIAYLWNNGQTTAQIQVDQTAVYTVLVSDSNSCHAEASFSFVMNPSPLCVITGETDICMGDTTELTSSEAASYFWSTGEVTRSIRIAPLINQNYILIVFNEYGCKSMANVQVTPHASEPIAIIGDSTFCEGDSVLLVAIANAELVWSNGHQGDSIYVYETGDYSVGTLNPSSCYHSSTIHVEKFMKPEVNIIGEPYLCMGETGTLYAQTNTSVSYQWSTGSTDSVIIVNSTNVYDVTVTDAFGCVNYASRLMMVYSPPSVGIDGPTSACNGSVVTLSATGSATHYQWSTGDTMAVITVNPRYTTDYTVIGADVFGCTASASSHMTVMPIPTVSISGDTLICEGEETTLTCSNASIFHWSTGAQTRSINVSQSGVYMVEVTNSSGCTNTASVYVQVNDYPNLIVLGDTMLCRGEQTELLAIGADNYLWSNGATTPNIVVSPEYSTSYTVQAANGECVSEITRQVIVNDKPVANIIAPDGVCNGSTATLTAQGGMAYVWSTGQTAAMIEVSSEGLYQLIAYNQYGCSDTTSHVLIQYPDPQVSIEGPAAICPNEQAVLSVVGSGSCLWSTGDTTSSIIVNESNYYYVQLTDNNGCVAMTGHNVSMFTSPVILIAGTDDICEEDTVNLTVSCVNAVSFSWNTGETSATISVSPSETTTYSVTAVSADDCTAQQSHILTVHPAYHADFTAEICQGYPYNGQGFSIPVQTEAGVFDFTNHLQTSFGCDSVRTLHLTVKPVPVITGGISGNSQVYTFGNHVYMIDPVDDAENYEWIVSNPNWSLTFNQTVAQVNVSSVGSATLSVYALNTCGQSLPASMVITYMGVGIDDMELSSVQVYPNPTDGSVNVKYDMSNGQLFDGEVQLFDMYGKLLNKWEMKGENKTLDLSSYAAGVYMLKLVNTQTASESVVKVVKQ